MEPDLPRAEHNACPAASAGLRYICAGKNFVEQDTLLNRVSPQLHNSTTFMDSYVHNYGSKPDYTAVRITHDDAEAVEAVFQGMEYVMSHMEVSKLGVKHFHLVTIGDFTGAVRGRYDKFKTGPSGKWRKLNYVSKSQRGDILTAISYTIKEGGHKVVGTQMEHWVPLAPKWVFKQQQAGAVDPVDKVWLLTERNLIPQMRKYVRDNPEYEGKDFATVLAALIEKTPWFPGHYLRMGIDKCFIAKFDKRQDDAAEFIVTTMIMRGASRYPTG